MRFRYSWIDENLDGSIRDDLTPAERSVWSDLCDLCGKSRRWGYIERSKGIPYTEEDLASRFKTPLDIVHSCIEKCLKEGRLVQDDSGALMVAHWSRYQNKKLRQLAEDGETKKDKPLLSPEDKNASQQAAAAKLAYLQPAAAKRGIGHREVEEKAKKLNKELAK